MVCWLPRTALAVGLVVGLASGCGGGDLESQAAAKAAMAFVKDVGQDPARACQLLAPATRARLEEQAGQPCTRAISTETVPDGRVSRVELASRSAQVMIAGHPVFLSRFDEGWRVVAAGCSREVASSSVPYTCRIEGG